MEMNVTHIAAFSKLRYVLVHINTYSGYLIGSEQTREVTKHVITQWLKCFSYMGIMKIKKIMGPYTLVKHCSTFVASTTSNIEFFIVLKDKELWYMPMTL